MVVKKPNKFFTPVETKAPLQGLTVPRKKSKSTPGVMAWTRPRKTIPGPQFNLSTLLAKEMREKNSIKPLYALKKTKMFLQAAANGAKANEAKKLANIPLHNTVEKIMSSPVSQMMLDEVLKHPEFQDEGISKRLKEMWHHKKLKVIKVVGPSMQKETVVEEDDTEMWKYSMDTVLSLRNLKKQGAKEEENPSGVLVASSINFNVLQIPSDAKAA